MFEHGIVSEAGLRVGSLQYPRIRVGAQITTKKDNDVPCDAAAEQEPVINQKADEKDLEPAQMEDAKDAVLKTEDNDTPYDASVNEEAVDNDKGDEKASETAEKEAVKDVVLKMKEYELSGGNNAFFDGQMVATNGGAFRAGRQKENYFLTVEHLVHYTGRIVYQPYATDGIQCEEFEIGARSEYHYKSFALRSVQSAHDVDDDDIGLHDGDFHLDYAFIGASWNRQLTNKLSHRDLDGELYYCQIPKYIRPHVSNDIRDPNVMIRFKDVVVSKLGRTTLWSNMLLMGYVSLIPHSADDAVSYAVLAGPVPSVFATRSIIDEGDSGSALIVRTTSEHIGQVFGMYLRVRESNIVWRGALVTPIDSVLQHVRSTHDVRMQHISPTTCTII